MTDKKGFTLIELLVVISIIAILMAILMPALNMAKDQARRLHCLSNVRSLLLAWYMYKDENDDKLVGGHVPNNANFKQMTETEYPDGYWVEPPQNSAGSFAGQPATRKEEWNGIERGTLFSYTRDLDLYRCPSDTRKRDPAQNAFRSYSIVGGANGENWTGYVKARKYTDIKRPAEKFIFVEESEPRGWNMGSWVVNLRDLSSWVDPLSIWHSKSRSTLGFADGRAELHTWVDKSTKEMAEAAAAGDTGSFNWSVPAGEGEDIEYMAKHFPYKSRD